MGCGASSDKKGKKGKKGKNKKDVKGKEKGKKGKKTKKSQVEAGNWSSDSENEEPKKKKKKSIFDDSDSDDEPKKKKKRNKKYDSSDESDSDSDDSDRGKKKKSKKKSILDSSSEEEDKKKKKKKKSILDTSSDDDSDEFGVGSRRGSRMSKSTLPDIGSSKSKGRHTKAENRNRAVSFDIDWDRSRVSSDDIMSKQRSADLRRQKVEREKRNKAKNMRDSKRFDNDSDSDDLDEFMTTRKSSSRRR